MHEHAQEETAAEPGARPAPPGSAPPQLGVPSVAAARMLQRTAGNQATLRWLQRDLEAEWPSTTFEEPAVPLAEVDAARKSALEKKYGVTVKGTWSKEDFTDLEDGLKLLTATEAKRLNGFSLIRVTTLTNNASGLTTVDGKDNRIEYADEAFDRGGGFANRTPLQINGGTQGRHVVCHEVGHAVLYTNSTRKAEEKWNANARSWITQELTAMKNGQVSAPVEELYCEAFACFKTGPARLKERAPEAYTYFANGEYLS